MATSPLLIGQAQAADSGSIEARLEQARKRLSDLQHQQAAEKFVAANPSYEANPANQTVMQEYLRANDFEPTYEGLEFVYGRLKAQGRIVVPAGIEDIPTTKLSAYQRELADRVCRAQEEIERGQRSLNSRSVIMPTNQFLNQQRNASLAQVGTVPMRVPQPAASPIVLTPQDKLRQSLKRVEVPSGRRVKNAIND